MSVERKDAVDPEKIVIEGQIEELVREVVCICFSELEYMIIQHRFEFDDCEILPWWKLGETLGISRERVSQIEVEANRKVKRELWKRGCYSYFETTTNYKKP
jgi:RNA polymerase sigma factor|nr:MAG TPA: DNA-directed RNA polymerase subunit sigma [Caudoviricetes sp.]